ncbi:MAG: hypothetical protein FD153_913, partial [Rhodospirillaceae bacterium]
MNRNDPEDDDGEASAPGMGDATEGENDSATLLTGERKEKLIASKEAWAREGRGLTGSRSTGDR